jgi:hypothetical protein
MKKFRTGIFLRPSDYAAFSEKILPVDAASGNSFHLILSFENCVADATIAIVFLCWLHELGRPSVPPMIANFDGTDTS